MSTIKADNIATLAGVSTSMAHAVNGSAKAWVNFNGTGTVAIRQSYNVSSITDLGVGSYAVNFTTAMPDANYVGNANNQYTTTNVTVFSAILTTSTSSIAYLLVRGTSNNATDSPRIDLAFFR